MNPHREEEIFKAVATSVDGDVARYHTDPWAHAQLEIIFRMCTAFDDAMDCEGIPIETRDRVRSRILLGDPEGIQDFRRRDLELRQQLASRAVFPVEYKPTDTQPGGS